MNARGLAAQVLLRVWLEDAYAAAALSVELERSNLDSRDRGLATEITYGVLRTQKYLEARLAAFGTIKERDHELRAHLLVAAYQIEFLDRVPARAAVNEAVKMVSASYDRKVGGFCNAILRRLSEAEEGRKSLDDAALASAPSWLRKRLVRDLGDEGARALLVPGRSHPPTLRVRGQVDGEFEAYLAEHTEPCAGVPGAFRYTAGGDPRKSHWFTEGRFVLQELGAQLVGWAVGARPGESVLDVCAGRGQKTSLLAEQVSDSGEVVATDLHQHKVDALNSEMARLGLKVEARTWDFTQEPPEELKGRFDRVLVDAPCSGVGTVVRRPEIARRLTAEDPARLAKLQADIATNAALCLKPGGVLLFATCSVLRDEAEAVVDGLLSTGLKPIVPATDVDRVIFTQTNSPEPSVRLLPHVHGTDGYFIARLAK